MSSTSFPQLTQWQRVTPWLIALLYLLSILPWLASAGLLMLSVTPEMEPLLYTVTCTYPPLLLVCSIMAVVLHRKQKRRATRWAVALPFMHILGLLLYYTPFFIPGLGG